MGDSNFSPANGRQCGDGDVFLVVRRYVQQSSVSRLRMQQD